MPTVAEQTSHFKMNGMAVGFWEGVRHSVSAPAVCKQVESLNILV